MEEETRDVGVIERSTEMREEEEASVLIGVRSDSDVDARDMKPSFLSVGARETGGELNGDEERLLGDGVD